MRLKDFANIPPLYKWRTAMLLEENRFRRDFKNAIKWIVIAFCMAFLFGLVLNCFQGKKQKQRALNWADKQAVQTAYNYRTIHGNENANF